MRKITDWEDRLQKIEDIAKKNTEANKKKKIYGFLDFDGVINVWGKEIHTDENESELESIRDAEFQFADRTCINLLSKLCIEYDIHIVISSSWRFAGVSYCYEYLRKVGMQRGIKVTGTTAQDLDCDREGHITDYLLQHPDYTGFIIFDDLQMEHLNDHLIHTETLKGYTYENDQLARNMIQSF